VLLLLVAAAVHVQSWALCSRNGHAFAACQKLAAAYAARAAHTLPLTTHSQADPQRQVCTAVSTHYLTTHEEEFDQQKCQPSATPVFGEIAENGQPPTLP
jgi:hypothetical protein